MMTDDALYGMMGLAHKLGLSLRDAMAMPYDESVMWNTYFERRNAASSLTG